MNIGCKKHVLLVLGGLCGVWNRRVSDLVQYLSSNAIHSVIEYRSSMLGREEWNEFVSMLIWRAPWTTHMGRHGGRFLFLGRGLECRYRHMLNWLVSGPVIGPSKYSLLHVTCIAVLKCEDCFCNFAFEKIHSERSFSLLRITQVNSSGGIWTQIWLCECFSLYQSASTTLLLSSPSLWSDCFRAIILNCSR